MKSEISERIISVMSAVFEIPANQIQNDSSPDTIESWDSLKQMNLIVALEEEFDLVFSDQQIFDMINFVLINNIIAELLENQK